MAKLIERGAVMQRLQERKLTQAAAAIRLGLSERQVRRLFKRYQVTGPKALIHKNKGKPSGRKIPIDQEEKAINWLKEHGSDFGSTFAQEKIQEYLDIKVSVGTMRTWRIKSGLHRPRRRSDKGQFQRRPRKSYFGAMVQIDGSPHDWFEGRGEPCVLLTTIEDATGLIVARFATGETTEDLMRLQRKYIEQYGIPLMAYTDHGGPYKINVGNADGEKLTQLGRAFKQLGVELIHANSPQAKGRVERNHKTNQDRLIKEMRLRGIATIEAANKYLEEEYIPEFNKRFVVKPAETENVHRPVAGFKLDNIFCIQEERVVQNDWIIQFKNMIFQITKNRIYVKPKNKVSVRQHFDGSITLWIDNIQLGYEQLFERPTQVADALPKILSRKPVSAASIVWNSGKYRPRQP